LVHIVLEVVLADGSVKTWRGTASQQHPASKRTYGLDVDLRKGLDEVRQRFVCVVDAFQQDRLVADYDPVFEQIVRRPSRNPGDLLGVVDVSVKTNLLSHLPALLR
jgi:hypothetical protein